MTVATRCPSSSWIAPRTSPRWPAMATRLLGVEVPAVEADRAVEPQRVIEAERRERRVRDLLRVRAEGHVEQEVVARVREQRGVQQRVVTDVARQPHPVRADPLGRGPPRKVGASPMRRSSGGGCSTQLRACRRSSGGRSRTQSCSEGSSSGVGRGRRRIRQLGARRGWRGTRQSRSGASVRPA